MTSFSTIMSIGYGALQLAFTDSNTFTELIKALVIEAQSANKKIIIDTARVYGDCEKLLGEVLKKNPGYRQWLFIIVKVGIMFDEKAPYCLTKDELNTHVTESLEKLGLSNVDCIMLHRLPRNHKNFDEAITTLKSFKDEKCQYIGLSEVSAETILSTNVDFVEIAYSPFSRVAEVNGVLEAARKTNCIVVTYTSVARGFLNGRVDEFVGDGVLKKEFRELTDAEFQKIIFEKLQINSFEQSIGYYEQNVLKKNIEVIANFIAFCQQKQSDPFQVCLAYNVAKGYIPIPGTTKIANLKNNISAINVKLDDNDLMMIDDITCEFKGDPNPNLLSYLSEV